VLVLMNLERGEAAHSIAMQRKSEQINEQ